jgi:hypothetical protein
MEPLSAGIIAGGGVMEGVGGMISSYMQAKSQERMERNRLRFEKEQFRHARDMNLKMDRREQESHDQGLAQNQVDFNMQLRNDAQSQAMYLNTLRAMNAARS